MITDYNPSYPWRALRARDLRREEPTNRVFRVPMDEEHHRPASSINNAGIYPFGPTHEMTEEQFDSVFSLNVKAPYFLGSGTCSTNG